MNESFGYSTTEVPTVLIPLVDSALSRISTFEFTPDITSNDDQIHSGAPSQQAAKSTQLIYKKLPNKRSPKEHTDIKLLDENPRTFNCELCNEKFHQSNLLRLHRQTIHVLFKSFRCPKCPEEFNVENNFTLHCASHARAPATCPECGNHFRRSAGYRGHLKMHLVNDDFRCKKCGQEFEYEEHYRRHLDREHGFIDSGLNDAGLEKQRKLLSDKKLKTFRCDICDKKFTKAGNLERHKIIHSKEKPFACDICSMKFTQKSSLQRHHLQHSGEKKLKCFKCSMRFSQHGNLLTHMQRVHPRNSDLTNKFPCPNCSCVFNKLNSLNRHSARMHSMNLTTIDEDNNEDPEHSFEKVMLQLKSLQHTLNPIAATTTDKNVSLSPTGHADIPMIGAVADVENLDSDSTGNYVKLVETLNIAKEKSEVVVRQIEGDEGKTFYSCGICSKQFRRPYDLLRHNRVHTKEKPYECGICGRCFAIKNNLQVHLRVHGKQIDRITNCYQCPECYFQFSSMRQLDNHVKIHGEAKLFPCKLCNKYFRSTNNLRVHESVHRRKSLEEIRMLKKLSNPLNENRMRPACDEVNRRFQCSICGLKFKRLSHLLQHEFSHTAQKPHRCLTCKKCFTVRSSLKTHQKIHYSHKTKECSDCDAKFHSNTELIRHKTVHSAARPYKCPHCVKAFKTKGTCKAHISTHLKELELKDENREAVGEVSSGCDDILLPSTSTQSDEFSVNLGEGKNIVITTIEESFSHETTQIVSHFQKKCSSSKFIEIDELLSRDLGKSIYDTITVESTDAISKANIPDPCTQLISSNNSSDEKRHICDMCGRAFKKPIDVRRHLRTHTKERPFECNICHASFKLKCTLETHKQVHEENRVKFDCQVCGKSYASQNVLKVHIRIHTNERPYKCKYCDKTFRTTGHKDAHTRKHTKTPRKTSSNQKRKTSKKVK